MTAAPWRLLLWRTLELTHYCAALTGDIAYIIVLCQHYQLWQLLMFPVCSVVVVMCSS